MLSFVQSCVSLCGWHEVSLSGKCLNNLSQSISLGFRIVFMVAEIPSGFLLLYGVTDPSEKMAALRYFYFQSPF
jgi:hypothetical protein